MLFPGVELLDSTMTARALRSGAGGSIEIDATSVELIDSTVTAQTLREIGPYILLAEKMGSYLAQRSPTPLRNLELSLGRRYVGSRADIDPVTFSTTEAASYEVYRVAASWRLTQLITVTARIENLLDEEYEDVLGFSTAERSGYVGLRFTLPPRSGPATSGLGS